MQGLLGILVALGLLIALAYRGVSVLVLAPLTALLAVVIAGDLPVLAAYTQLFMRAAGDFIVQYFPVFLLGALFGRLMDDSGAARSIAEWTAAKLGDERAILAVVLSCAALTYGGVSLFVVAFAVFPIADALFRRADIPKRLIPATIALGAFTFTMTALPGSPAIQNAIPMPFFGTTAFAAPGLGLIAGAIMLAGGQWWLLRRSARARSAGEGYGNAAAAAADDDERPLPPVAVAALPIALVIALNFLFASVLVPTSDPGVLAEPRFGATDLAAVRGIWAIIIALSAAIVALWLLNRTRLPDLKRSLDAGASASVLPIFNTASQVGFGAVVAALSAFALLRDAVMELGGNPLVTVALSSGALAGITGSASGGMSIALEALGQDYIALARAEGVSLELMHRVIVVATGGLDSLPHNGAVITLLGICGLSHRQSYADIAVVALLIPLVALAALVALGTVFGAF